MYEYDGEGRLVSSRPEVEWDDGEREWMIALAEYRRVEDAKRCHLCGLPKDVCRAYETDGAVQVDWERCHVATAVQRKQTALSQGETPAEYLGAVEWKPKLPTGGLGDLVPETTQ